ncbi:MAG: zinc ribbon domain-containing protein [Paramuribaculum sp.]|nr:zinc ribbon domain-containing protein [Paramuribaculum sp.]
MALRDCPECGKMISDKAERCPHCGVDPRKARENVAPERKPLEATTAYGSNGPNNGGGGGKKKLWLILVLLILIGVGVAIWVPAYQHKKDEELARIEQIRQDSIAAVEAELARLEQLRQDSIEWVNFTSPDLALFNIHGHAKSVKGNFYDEGISKFFSGNPKEGYEFSYEGVTDKVAKNEYYDKLIYDNDGYIIKGKGQNDLGGIELTWTKDKKLKKIVDWFGTSTTETTFNYDDDGNVKNVTEEFFLHGVETTKRNYKIIEKDKFGNWIKMSYNEVKTIDYSGYDLSRDVESKKTSGVLTREITYYTDDNGYPLIVKE